MKRYSCGHSFLLGVNKPLGLSSHDVVSCVRRFVGESKVGHAGTLDPAASGVLVIGVGQATRLLGHLTLDDKCYLARITFGSETSTDDAEGEVVRTAPVEGKLADAEYARGVLESLEGEHDQIPPAYSAISVGGTRAYALARKGADVELEARHIAIYDATLVSIDDSDGISWICSFSVSKGTYIRSIARDLGRSLGTAAHLSGLSRTASGTLGLERCISLGELEQDGLSAALDRMLDPLELLGIPSASASEGDIEDILCGKSISAGLFPGIPDGGEVCVICGGRLWSLAYREAGRIAARANFPDGIEGVLR